MKNLDREKAEFDRELSVFSLVNTRRSEAEKA